MGEECALEVGGGGVGGRQRRTGMRGVNTDEKRKNVGVAMEENKRERQRQKGKRGAETESAAERHSCGEQADSAQQSKHTAGLP